MNRNSMADDSHIDVVVKLRPLLGARKEEVCWRIDSRKGEIVQTKHSVRDEPSPGGGSSLRPLESFPFESIFDDKSTNSQLYEAKCRGIIASVLEGYNGTILLYGQTKSGTAGLTRKDLHDARRRAGVRLRAAVSERHLRLQVQREGRADD